MTIQTNTTERKAMAHAIAEHLGTQAVYLGPPTFGYQAGVVSINSDASISAADAEIQELLPFLRENGWVEETTANELQTSELVEAPIEQQDELPSENVNVAEAKQVIDSQPIEENGDADFQETPFPPDTCVSLPLTAISPSQVINILRMIYARQELIRAMTQSEIVFMDEEIIRRIQDEKPQTHEAIRELLKQSYDIQMLRGVYMDEERFMAAFPIEGLPLEKQAAYMMLMTKAIDFGARAKRVNAVRIVPQPEEMKYFCHTWLIQIGFKGAEYKNERAVLLNHLTGYAAFKTTEKMLEHKEKYAELRRNYRDLEQSNTEEQEHSKTSGEEDNGHDEN